MYLFNINRSCLFFPSIERMRSLGDRLIDGEVEQSFLPFLTPTSRRNERYWPKRHGRRAWRGAVVDIAEEGRQEGNSLRR